jgi:hypothetical protein
MLNHKNKLFLAFWGSICFVTLFTFFGEDKFKEEFKTYLNENPYNQSEAHPGFPISHELSKRLFPIPEFVIQQLNEWDGMNYSGVQLSDREQAELDDCLDSLPAPILKAFKAHVHGIYVINADFKGMGMMDASYSKNLKIDNFLILNHAIFSQKLDDWLTAKEMTNFKIDNLEHVRIRTGVKLPALLGLMIHEGMHLLDYQGQFSPEIEPAHKKWMMATNKVNTKLPWLDLYDHIKPLSFQKNITFYGMSGGPKLLTSQMLEVYDELSQQAFPSLYGAKLIPEDFAELGLFGYLVQMKHADYKVEIMRGSDVIFTWKPFDHSDMKKRLKGFDLFLNESSPE